MKIKWEGYCKFCFKKADLDSENGSNDLESELKDKSHDLESEMKDKSHDLKSKVGSMSDNLKTKRLKYKHS